MRIGDRHFRTLWLADDGWSVHVIDQTQLPGKLDVLRLTTVDDAAHAIRSMQVRGAPLIGVTAAYGLCLALRSDASDQAVESAYRQLMATRPTAVNLRWALDQMMFAMRDVAADDRGAMAYQAAARLADDDVAMCAQIGTHGEQLLRARWTSLGRRERLNVLTHCNAGWLATIDWGTALAPIYRAHDSGVPVHVWVDDAARNQGYLTAWELAQHGVPHTVIVDNAGGLLMQQGSVDLCIVGTDRTVRNGDVANKIGTYLKALAAHDNGVPFYVAVPSTSIDWRCASGDDIPIEERAPAEVHTIPGIAARNPGFDITPARLVTGLVTERGVCAATAMGLRSLFPEQIIG